MDMVDRQGNVVQVPDEQVPQAYQSGAFGFVHGSPVHLVTQDGRVGHVAPEQAWSHIQAGARIASPEEVHQAQMESRYGGIGASLAAAGEGVARGVTLGMSDPLAIEGARLFGGDNTAEAVRQHLEGVREEHPWLSTGGEVLGAVAPVLLTGGAAAPEEAAAIGAGEAARSAGAIAKIADGVRTIGVLPRAVTGAGDLAEGLATSALGRTASTALGRAGQAAAKQAIRGVVEGGLFGAGQEISDSALQNRPLTAEKLFATVGRSALLGGVLGGAAGGAGNLTSEGVGALAEKLAPKLDEESAAQAWKWLAPKSAIAKQAMARAGGTEEVGRVVREDVLRPLVEKEGLAGAMVTPEEKLELVRQAVDRTGKQIGELIETNPHATVRLGDMLDPIDKRYERLAGEVMSGDKLRALSELKASLAKVFGVDVDYAELTDRAEQSAVNAGLTKGTDAFRSRVDDKVAEMASDAIDAMAEKPVSIGDAIKQRRALQQRVYGETKALDPKLRVQLLREISGEWGDIEEKALDAASGESAAGKQLAELNKRYQRLKLAEAAAESTTASHAVNRNFSLSDNLWGAAHFSGAMAAGHPIAAAAAIGTTMAHKAIREHGNAYASLLLDRLATWGGVSRAAAEADAAVGAAVKAAVSRTASSPYRGLPQSPKKLASEYEEQSSRVRRIAALPLSELSAHLARQTAPVATHAPETASALSDLAIKSNRYLLSKMPKPAGAEPSLTPHLDTAHISAEQKASWLRTLRAVDDGPVKIAQRLASGHITAEDVDALKAIYPEWYGEMRSRVLLACADRKSVVPYQAMLRLGRLFDLPVDETMTPDFVKATQGAWQSQGAKPSTGPAPGGGRSGAAPASLGIEKDAAGPFEQAQRGAA